MTAERPDALGPWCTECGAPATVTAASVDAAHPFGRCRAGHGKRRVGTVLTYSPDERLAAQRRAHRRGATRLHYTHTPDGNVSPYCDHCNAAGWSYPPDEPGTIAAGTSPAAGAPGRRP